MELTKAELISELKDFKQDIFQAIKDENRLSTDLLRQEMRAYEIRIDGKLIAMEERITAHVTDVIGNGVVPQIENHDEQLGSHERRIAALEVARA